MTLGEPLTKICRDIHLPQIGTFFEWLDDPVLNERYARAERALGQHYADEIVSIADDSSGDVMLDEDGEPKVNTEFIQRSKLRVDARKWVASKLFPRLYGDKQTIEQTTVTIEQPRKIDFSKFTPEQLDALDALLEQMEKQQARITDGTFREVK